MRRRLALVLGIALAVVASLGAGGAAQALWSANATATTSASSGTVAATASGLDGLGYRFTSSSATSTTTLVRLSNTGTLPVTGFTSTIGYVSGSQALASAITWTIWDAGRNATSCPSAPAASSTGNWGAATLTMPAPATAIPAQAPAAYEGYCVTSTLASSAPAGQTVKLTLSVTALDQKWVSATPASAAISFTSPAADPAVVAPAQAGISTPAGSNLSDVSLTMPQGDVPWGSTSNSNINPTSGQITNQKYTCVIITVTGQSGATGDWSFQLDNSVAPFNGAILTNAMFATSGYQSAQILAKPSNGVGSYTIGGIHQGSATTFNQQVWNDPRGSDGFSSYVWNTPLPPKQTTQVHLCLNIDGTPPVKAQGAGTYTVAQPVLAGCPADGINPATAGSSAMTSPIPSNGNVCLYVTLTGLYPHFYIGYTVSIDWAALVKNSSLTASQKAKVLGESAYSWSAYGSDGSSDQAVPTLSNGVLTWTVAQQHTPLEITNGLTVVLTGTFGLN
ncbi:hypothetical protein [Gryllotalpicola koreensis]|uniref:Uncharacterized protein n=1 Tax=Gryllotalpicola koreensis TaxID=993086 RepID=A0ABP8A0C6_9MICO